MDIKLKNNKLTVNRKILILSLCVALLPILLGLSKEFINSDSTNQDKIKLYYKYTLNLLWNSAYNDETGNIRKDAIDREMDLIKNDEKDNLNNNDIKYRNQAIKNIKNTLTKNGVVNNPVNLEYYIELQNGQIISNISGKSKNEIIDETRKLKDYVIFLDITNNSPKEKSITRNMPWDLSELIHYSGINSRNELVDFKNVIIRIPAILKSGDNIYSESQIANITNVICNVSLFLIILDLYFLITFVLKFIKRKETNFKETTVIKLYNKQFIEIKIFAIILMIILLLGLYNIIACWGNSLIELHISRLLDPAYLYDAMSITFYEQLLCLFIGVSIIGYLVMCDIYQLYLNKTEIRQNIFEKSIFRMTYNKFNNMFSNKLMNKKLLLTLIIFVLYLVSIVWSILLFSSHSTFLFYLLHNVWPYSIPPFWFIGPLIINIFGTVLVMKYIIAFFIDINKIKAATDNIVNGTYNNKLKIKNSSILKELADNIMNIEYGLDNAITNAVKSERMKSELITNVSHDLKTPLTSIINYVDLLDKNNISEDKKKEYLGILKERSGRLKVLIEDLFEASKAASGNLKMHMENLDPVALLRQTLGEFEDRITNSNLYFIKNVPDYKLTIYADGRRTFRVFQNLISNILKYSLNGTRVYIDVEDKDKFVSITFKNISKYPLNFTEEEILERFKRGDSSRTTEGSGLGLAIAKSLVELQKGTFHLKFDGDLFKVIILLKKENF